MIDPGSEVVDLFEAMRLLDVPEEVLGRLAQQGKLKSRHADGTIYFLRDEIEALVGRQLEELTGEAEL